MKRSKSRTGMAITLALSAGASFASAQHPDAASASMRSMTLPKDRQVLPASELPPLPEVPSGFFDAAMVADLGGAGLQSSYTLDELLQLAATNNPTIRQAQRQISGETAKALQAGLYPNPMLMYVGEKINSGGRLGEFQGFEIQQRFVTANKLQLSRLKYRQRAHVAEHLAIAIQS